MINMKKNKNNMKWQDVKILRNYPINSKVYYDSLQSC